MKVAQHDPLEVVRWLVAHDPRHAERISPDEARELAIHFGGVLAACTVRAAERPEAAGAAGPTLLTADELAARLAMPKPTIYELARLDKIPSVRVGRRVRFDEAAVRAALTKENDNGNPEA